MKKQMAIYKKTKKDKLGFEKNLDDLFLLIFLIGVALIGFHFSGGSL